MIDAADNAAELAEERNQPCFVHTILNSIKHEPIDGLDIVLSCRGHRKSLVVKNYAYEELPLGGLPKLDCLEWIRAVSTSLTSEQVDKIYSQARGNPRKIEYLLKLNLNERPNKDTISLDEIFDTEWTRIASRLEDQGFEQSQINQIMAAIARLPPPIPLYDLGKALQVSEGFLKSLTSELFPLLEEAHDGLIFRDEPIETWFRKKFSANSQPVADLIKIFMIAQDKSIFAASALPQLLVEAKDLNSLLLLAQSDNFPTDIATQSAKHRLAGNRILAALRLATDAKKISTCMSLLYRYGRLATVDERADTYVVDNIALAAYSNDQDASLRCWNNRSGWEGSWPARMAIYGAIRGDDSGALNASFTFDSWLEWWFRTGREESSDDHGAPRLSVEECVAKSIALTSNGRISDAIDQILRWYPPAHQKEMGRRYLHLLRYLGEVSRSSVLGVALDRIKTLTKKDMQKDRGSDDSAGTALGLALASYEFIEPGHLDFVSLSRILNQELKDYKLEYKEGHSRRPPDPILSHQLLAAKAMANKQKSLCKSLIKSGYQAEPSLYRFHDEFEQGKLGFFLIQRVISAWAVGRELSRWDLLPYAFRKRVSKQNCVNKKDTSSAIEAAIKKANKKKSEKKQRNPLAFNDRDSQHFQWVVSELYSFASLLSKSLREGVDFALISGLLDLVQRDKTGAPYFLHHSAYNLRRHLFVATLKTILFCSQVLDDTSLKGLKDRLTPELLVYDHDYSILEYLHRTDPNDKIKSALSVALVDRVSDYETVDERAKAYSKLADRVMNFDGESAKRLFLKGLNCIDGVGSDDDDLVRALLGLASAQKGGNLSLKASNRFLRLCEITFEHREDKFPFDELAEASAQSVGVDYFRYLFGWHSATTVPLHYALLPTVSRFSDAGVMPAKHAALASLLTEGIGGSLYVSADDQRYKIWENLPENDKDAVRDLFDWQRKFESSAEASWCPEEVAKTRQEEYPPLITEDQFDISFDGSKTKSWNAVNTIALNLDPKQEGFVERVVSEAMREEFHVDTSPLIYTAATTRLTHMEVLPFLDQIIEASDLHAQSKISLVHAILKHWRDSSIVLRECQTDFYKKLLRVAAPEYLDDQFGASRLLSNLAAFSGLDRADVALDFCDWIGKNREEIGSVTTFSLAQALIPQSSPTEARKALEEFLQTTMFLEMDKRGHVPVDVSCPAEIKGEQLLPEMIWHQLGDPDATLRWRAVHTMVKTAQMGDSNAVNALFDLFDNPAASVLAHPDHKQHIWNAREYWLIAALNIARKCPDILVARLEWFRGLADGRFRNIILERYAGNTLHLLEQSLGRAPIHSLNHFPVAVEPLSSREGYYDGDYWEFTKLEDAHGFRLDYDFRKSHPVGFVRNFDISLADAATLFMATIKSLDSDCEGMSDAAGRPNPHQDHRDFKNERRISYGQHIARHAVLETTSKLIGVRRHIKWHRFRPGLRETLLTFLFDIKRRLCGIASVDVRLFFV